MVAHSVALTLALWELVEKGENVEVSLFEFTFV